MIVVEDAKAITSIPPPPTFEESVDHVILDSFHERPLISAEGTGEDLPPDFAPYEADFFKSGDGTIVSHDPHLNEDGEALYRFLLSQASVPPTCLLHCVGTHSETRTRMVTHTNKHGKLKHRSETYVETVTDFDFSIDIGQNIPAGAGPVHWSVPDSEPAYRGKMMREVELGVNEASVLGGIRRKATKPEVKMFRAWEDERRERGLPPWVGSELRLHGQADSMAVEENGGLRSSKTVRDWADEYCASKKHLKEFTYKKVIHGWNIDALKSAIHTTIISTSYAGKISISFDCTANMICVRPDNRLSRVLSNPWLKFLMFITLVYPFIWLYKRFHAKGGGRWEVCGGAYALKRVVPVDQDEANPDSKSAIRDEPPEAGPSSRRVTKVVGLKEGQWLRQWEGSIKQLVTSRRQSSIPLTLPQMDAPNEVAMLLDGYTD